MTESHEYERCGKGDAEKVTLDSLTGGEEFYLCGDCEDRLEDNPSAGAERFHKMRQARDRADLKRHVRKQHEEGRRDYR